MESETLMTDKLSARSHGPIPYLGFDSGYTGVHIPGHYTLSAAILGVGGGFFTVSSFPPHISYPSSSHNSLKNHFPFNMSPSAPTQVRTGLGQGQDPVSQTSSMRRWVQTSQLCLGTVLSPLREFLCEMSLWRSGCHRERKLN